MPPSVADTSLTVHELRDLGDLRGPWDRLVEGLPVPSPFLRTWWLDAQPEAGRRYLVVREPGGELVGGLPVVLDRIAGTTRIRLLGAGPLTPDHLDAVAAPGRSAEVASALDGWVRARRPAVLDLDGVVEDAALARVWGPVETVEVAPYRALASVEDYAGRLSSSHRLTLRRAERKMARQGVAHVRVGDERLGEALAEFRRLQEVRPGRERLVAALPVLERAVRAGHARGEVRVDVLTGPPGTYAVMIAFVTGGRLSLYQVARSLEREAAGAGNLLMHEVFCEAAESGCREIDMLRGGEAYKSKFVDRSRPLGRIRRGVGVRGRVVAASWRAGTTVGRAARRWGQRWSQRWDQRLAEVSGWIRRLREP